MHLATRNSPAKKWQMNPIVTRLWFAHYQKNCSYLGMQFVCVYVYVYVEFYVYHIYIYMYTHINVLMFTLDFKTLAIFECRNCTVRIIQPRPFKSKVFPRTCLFRTVWRAVFQLDLNSLQSFNGGAKYLFSKSRSCIRLNVSMKGLKGLSLKPTAIGVNPFN